MDGSTPPAPKKEWNILGAGIYAWICIAVAVTGVVGGGATGIFFVGKAAGSNQYLLDLPARVDALQQDLERKIVEAQRRDSEAFQAQVLINQRLLDALTDLRKDLSVNDTRDAAQQESISRLERAVESLRDLLNRKT